VLLRSGARFCETALLISSLQSGALETSAAVRIGAPMTFGRLWEQTDCRQVIEQLAKRPRKAQKPNPAANRLLPLAEIRQMPVGPKSTGGQHTGRQCRPDLR
jgi:hypothetical protein